MKNMHPTFSLGFLISISSLWWEHSGKFHRFRYTEPLRKKHPPIRVDLIDGCYNFFGTFELL